MKIYFTNYFYQLQNTNVRSEKIIGRKSAVEIVNDLENSKKAKYTI